MTPEEEDRLLRICEEELQIARAKAYAVVLVGAVYSCIRAVVLRPFRRPLPQGGTGITIVVSVPASCPEMAANVVADAVARFRPQDDPQ